MCGCTGCYTAAGSLPPMLLREIIPYSVYFSGEKRRGFRGSVENRRIFTDERLTQI